MKKNLLLAAALLTGIFAGAQDTAVTVNLQPGYASQVYYKFSTNTQTAVAATSWDIAFQKASGMGLGAISVNDGKGITVYQASADAGAWANINVANESSWATLYNSFTTWTEGALNNANNDNALGFGWGNYDMSSHHVYGAIIFVLKYSDGSYKKLFVEDYNPFDGSTKFKYATWDGAAWSADTEYTVGANNVDGYDFNYYSLTTNAEVPVAPADAAWDLVFRKYNTDINEGTGQDALMYNVTGALQNSNVTVAQADETGATETTPTLPDTAAYSADINTIGDDWKTFNMTTFVYEVNPEVTYYVKDAAGTIYRVFFTAFAGSSAGTLTFNYRNVSAAAGVNDVNAGTTFAIYPNPTADKNVTLVYDLKSGSANSNVSIYSITGAKVFETAVTNQSGFYTKQLNLGSLSSGLYIVTLTSGNVTATQKLVIQ